MKTGILTQRVKLLSALGMACMAAIPSTALAYTVPKEIVQQQNKTTGNVVDKNGEPIIGATVKIKGKQTGVVTDFDGNFTIDAPRGSVLIVSYIGFDNQEISVDGKPINVTLTESSEQLNEVVVIGYGSMRKRDLTGAVAQVRPDKIANEAPSTVQDVLRGTAGLNVGFDGTAKGGGSLTVRGQRSVYTSGDHNAPLIVLDGMVF